ncbi:MAG: PqqD family protein [Rothia sp. (in: high G+C Gram-positive bacteria)]|uniref:PqqD family protein n=1 Tax=Rothia sp. (in: high G+C Gram-positive bacteria) TaxID=1885016 RepID=UPI0026E01758|nr:PqqD family protein [Rothia sp. (in: high G+C Gram-positive bacteria)]MDO5750283.1 PqqD family protein [Rothia sp. (in: high G+C Gram-positive bacteria)]
MADKNTRYVFPEHIAYVHSEDINQDSETASYVADLNTNMISVLAGPASIMWGVFEEPASMPEASVWISQMVDVPVEEIESSLDEFIPQLLEQGLLQIAD